MNDNDSPRTIQSILVSLIRENRLSEALALVRSLPLEQRIELGRALMICFGGLPNNITSILNPPKK